MGFTPQGEVDREVNKHSLSTYHVTGPTMIINKTMIAFKLYTTLQDTHYQSYFTDEKSDVKSLVQDDTDSKQQIWNLTVV